MEVVGPTTKTCFIRSSPAASYANLTGHQHDGFGAGSENSLDGRSVGRSLSGDEEYFAQVSSEVYFSGIPKLTWDRLGGLSRSLGEFSENRFQNGNRIDSPAIQLLQTYFGQATLGATDVRMTFFSFPVSEELDRQRCTNVCSTAFEF